MTARSLWVAKTGMDAQQTRMSVISNNLANVNTNAFKKDRAVFEDLLYQNVRQVGGASSQTTELPSGLQLGTGVRTVATQKIHTEGAIINTGNALDVAINGDGFFQIQMPDGTIGYTRDGAFQLNQNGDLVTSSGYPVIPNITGLGGGNFVSVTIGSDGTVSGNLPNGGGSQNIGNIDTANFVNPAGLESLGGNLFRETNASGPPIVGQPGLDGRGTLNQGMLETSNVNVVEELVNMIEAQRAYEMNSKAIATTNDMLGFASNTL